MVVVGLIVVALTVLVVVALTLVLLVQTIRG